MTAKNFLVVVILAGLAGRVALADEIESGGWLFDDSADKYVIYYSKIPDVANPGRRAHEYDDANEVKNVLRSAKNNGWEVDGTRSYWVKADTKTKFKKQDDVKAIAGTYTRSGGPELVFKKDGSAVLGGGISGKWKTERSEGKTYVQFSDSDDELNYRFEVNKNGTLTYKGFSENFGGYNAIYKKSN